MNKEWMNNKWNKNGYIENFQSIIHLNKFYVIEILD